MSVSRSPAPSSIDLSGVPARVAEAVAQVVAVCLLFGALIGTPIGVVRP